MWGRVVEALGFGNGKGHLSFNKMVTFTALQCFVFAVVTRREPTWALLSFGVVVVGAGFGLKGFLGAVKQNSMTAQTTVTADLTKITEIVAKRDQARGIDPA
jgi:hypothetical protein